MKALIFNVTLLQPLLVTELGAGEENASTALEFIPGSVLRGELINRYLGEYKGADAAIDPACRNLFFEDRVLYLNAYPHNRLGQRTLPKPLSWRFHKDDLDNAHATLYDLAADDPHLEGLAPPSEPFCWKDEGFAELGQPARYVGFHNFSRDRNRKVKGESTVYRYESLSAGQVFGAVVLSKEEAELQILRPLVDGVETTIGGSRSAGYGSVRFEDAKIVPNWREYDPDDVPGASGVVVTLLSDAILRNESGHPDPDFDRALGFKHDRAFQRTRIVGGFNRKWGLPLAQVPALQAGSVFVYSTGQFDLALLQQIERTGIGERRNEGFGRVAINWHTQATMQRRVVRGTPTPASKLSPNSQSLAQQMVNRLLRKTLDRKLLAAVSELHIVDPPSHSQLSRFRIVLRRAWQERNETKILEHLRSLKAAQNQFEQARIGNVRLSRWLREGMEHDKIWKDRLRPAEIPSIAGVVARPTEELKLDYTLRLLDALFRTAAKEPDEGGIK